MAGYAGPWWVSGGWAVEAFTRVGRAHHDLDLELPAGDLPALRRHLAGRLDAWTADDGALRPLPPTDDPEGDADQVLPPGCRQLWTRRSGAEPWEYDVLLASVEDSTWVCKRDARVRLPLHEVLWWSGGVRYLRPEVQLLLKARGLRSQDQQDLEACLPVLDGARRGWLRASLALVHPGHPWLAVL